MYPNNGMNKLWKLARSSSTFQHFLDQLIKYPKWYQRTNEIKQWKKIDAEVFWELANKYK